jgi:hypothetical protein
MYRLQDAHLLGNSLPTTTWNDFLGSTGRRRYGLRHRSRTGFPHTRPVGDAVEFHDFVSSLISSGEIAPEDVLVTDITELDDTRKTLQGEIMLDETGRLSLFHSGRLWQTWTCREEMRQPSIVERGGLEARAYIETFMDQRSQDTLEELLRTYPTAVVEVSCFAYRLGWDKTNTLFWEVRDY